MIPAKTPLGGIYPDGDLDADTAPLFAPFEDLVAEVFARAFFKPTGIDVGPSPARCIDPTPGCLSASHASE